MNMNIEPKLVVHNIYLINKNWNKPFLKIYHTCLWTQIDAYTYPWSKHLNLSNGAKGPLALEQK